MKEEEKELEGGILDLVYECTNIPISPKRR